MSPSVTVAIPTYNGERHLAEALRGVLAQEDAEFDLLVCDDRSDDRTLELVRDEAGDRARIVTGSERLGLAANWNRCMAESRTPWVAIFHQDDVMRPGHLRDHLAAIRSGDDSLGLVTSPSDVIDEDSRLMTGAVGRGSFPAADSGGASPGTDRWLLFPPSGVPPFLATGNGLRCSAVTTSKRAHAEVGGFDASYRYVVDWDFWARACKRFGLAAFMGPATVSVRWHSGSETHRFKATLDDLEETERLVKELGTFQNRQVKQGLGRAYLNRAYDALHAGRIELAREALRRSVRLAPSLVATMLADPRLAAQMAALTLAPGLARRWCSTRRDD